MLKILTAVLLATSIYAGPAHARGGGARSRCQASITPTCRAIIQDQRNRAHGLSTCAAMFHGARVLRPTVTDIDDALYGRRAS